MTKDIKFASRIALLNIVMVCGVFVVEGYAPGDSLRRDEIAGIWRLTSMLPKLKEPIKEYGEPPKKLKDRADENEVFFKLNQDGSFLQYANAGETEETEGKSKTLQGTWDYRGRKLILAPDRPAHSDRSTVIDTMIIGEVVAQTKESLTDHPTVPLDDVTQNQTQASKSKTDVYLTMRKGKVSEGKFTYPKSHPSFFDQPMFKPIPTATIELRQVLGVLNAREDEGDTEQVEKFKQRDFYGKKFWLTSFPVQPKRGKAELKWNRKAGRYVSNKKDDDVEKPVDIRVMPIEFFTNNTFSATGSSKILRGRFSVTGDLRDKLWFFVSLFGFGRSNSGSVYSEGKGLSHEDRRGYWGNIRKNDEGETKEEQELLSVEGTVLVGREPVARFTMKEVESTLLDDEDEDDDVDFDSVFE